MRAFLAVLLLAAAPCAATGQTRNAPDDTAQQRLADGSNPFLWLAETTADDGTAGRTSYCDAEAGTPDSMLVCTRTLESRTPNSVTSTFVGTTEYQRTALETLLTTERQWVGGEASQN